MNLAPCESVEKDTLLRLAIIHFIGDIGLVILIQKVRIQTKVDLTLKGKSHD